MKRQVLKVEKHLYENKNHVVNVLYRIFYEGCLYADKTKSQLTKTEKNFEPKTIYHF